MLILYVRNHLLRRNAINVALGFEIKLLQERVKGNGVFQVEDEQIRKWFLRFFQ